MAYKGIDYINFKDRDFFVKYSESAYIYLGGFPFEITEGDLVIVFSQYGEVVDCRIVRDKETGKSKGFGFICYEDQRSTILAVDNLNGSNICGRVIRVDHVEQYKIPREYFDADDFDEKGEKKMYKPSGPDGKGWGEDRILTPEEIKIFEDLKRTQEIMQNKILREGNVAQGQMALDADEKWERDFLKIVDQTKEEELKFKEEKADRKRKKKEKKEKKKAKKTEKEEKKRLKKENEMKEIYKSYGLNTN